MATPPEIARRMRIKRRVRKVRYAFSKVMIAIVTVGVIAANICSYDLAYKERDTNENVTDGINKGYGAVLVAYFVKSLGEHWSMNKFGVEEEEE